MRKKVLKNIVIIAILILCSGTYVFAAICEEHTYAEADEIYFIQYYFYSSGRTWDFTAENDLTLSSVELSVRMAGSGSYIAHLQIQINGEVIASWSQSLTTTYTTYTYYTGTIDEDLREGDTITFNVYGGTSYSSGGAVTDSDDNYVKLCGEEWVQPPPTVATESASHVMCSSANLNATVNPNGDATSYYFEYGLSTSYGSSTSPVDIGSGSDDVSVAETIRGLDCNTTYHYRIVANNGSTTTSYGDDMAFTTSEKCTVNTAIYLLLLSDD